MHSWVADGTVHNTSGIGKSITNLLVCLSSVHASACFSIILELTFPQMNSHLQQIHAAKHSQDKEANEASKQASKQPSSQQTNKQTNKNKNKQQMPVGQEATSNSNAGFWTQECIKRQGRGTNGLHQLSVGVASMMILGNMFLPAYAASSHVCECQTVHRESATPQARATSSTSSTSSSEAEQPQVAAASAPFAMAAGPNRFV